MKKDIDDIKKSEVKNEENNKIMREHINFIERVYDQVSAPLNWACEKFNRTIGYNIYTNDIEYWQNKYINPLRTELNQYQNG